MYLNPENHDFTVEISMSKKLHCFATLEVRVAKRQHILAWKILSTWAAAMGHVSKIFCAKSQSCYSPF